MTLQFCQAVKAAIAATFPTCYVGVQHEADQLTLPAIIIDARADSVLNSPLYRGTMTVSVMSQADDTTTTAHGTLTKAVGAAIDALSISSSDVTLDGLVSVSTDASRAERHYITNLQYTVGFTRS